VSGKISKASVDYRVAPYPGRRRCGNCVMFYGLWCCTLVEGGISPLAVCDRWQAR
jgi:hypothetical protein